MRSRLRLLVLALVLLSSFAFGALAPDEAAAQPECSDYPLLPTDPYWDPTDRTYAPCAVQRAKDAGPDGPPTNPYCDIYNPQPGRVCVTVKKDFTFQAVDTSRTDGNNLCTVTLEGAAPEDQTDPYNRPDVQYRSSLKCQIPLQVVDIKPAIYTASGGFLASGSTFHCHALAGGCPTTGSAGGRGLREGGTDYRQTTYIRLVLPGGPDPWIAAEGRPGNPNDPTSCSPAYQKGYVIECLLDLDIPATPPQ